MSTCWVFLLRWSQSWLRVSSFNHHKHPSGQENPECGDAGWKVQDKMWCELPQAWTQSFNRGKRMSRKSEEWVQGERKGYFRWRKRLFAHSTEWRSSCKRCANRAHLGIVSQTFRSQRLFMLQDIIADFREPSEGEAWALTHPRPSSINCFSQASFWAFVSQKTLLMTKSWILGSSPLIEPPEHGIVFVSRLLWYWAPLYSFSQENPSSLHWCKLFVCQWCDTCMCSHSKKQQHLLTSKASPTPWFLWFDPWKFSLPVVPVYPLCAWIRLIDPSHFYQTINRCLCSFKNQFVLVQCLFLTAQSLAWNTSGPSCSGPPRTSLLGQAWEAFLEATPLNKYIFMYLAIADDFSLTHLKVPKISMEVRRQKRLN